MSPPDVTLVAPYPAAGSRHSGTSGVASYTANLAEALAGRGAAVRVIAPRESGAEASLTDGTVTVERPFVRGPRSLSRACDAALDTGAPIIHLQHEHFLFGGATSVPALLAALARIRKDRRGSVVTMHQVVHPASVDRDFTRMHRVHVPARLARVGVASLQRWISRHTSACIVHETSFADSVPGAVVIPHGVEPGSRLTKADARQQLGLDDRFMALCFGFVAPYKGLELALEAARHVRPDVHVVIAGGEHPRLAGRDAYAGELRRAYPEATFTGHVPNRDVSRWFRAADVVLLTHPKPHGSSGALALALAHDTPVVLSRGMAAAAAAHPDLAVADDPCALARRLLVLASSPTRRAELRELSRPLAAERAWPSVADAHLALYQEVQSCPWP